MHNSVRYKHTTSIKSNKTISPTGIELQLGIGKEFNTMESKGKVMDVNITRWRMRGKNTCKEFNKKYTIGKWGRPANNKKLSEMEIKKWGEEWGFILNLWENF